MALTSHEPKIIYTYKNFQLQMFLDLRLAAFRFFLASLIFSFFFTEGFW